MSAGGINVQQPLVGAPPTGVGASSQPAVVQPQIPVAGVEAGSVSPSGGLVQDGLPRTAAIGSHVAANAYGTVASASAASTGAARTQVLDPAAVQAGTAAVSAGATGPAAWDESWAKKFRDAGAPTAVTQQLAITGAMGADAKQLEQMLTQIKGELDPVLAKFAHDHPEEFKKLHAVEDLHKWVDQSGSSNRATLAQIAMGLEAGQITKQQLTELADTAGKSQGKVLFDTLVKPMIVWSLIPGWGAIRLGFAPFTGGKDILTGERMFADPLSTTFTIMAGIGGGITLFNHARGAMQVAQGHRLVAGGGDAALIAANEGFGTLKGFDKVKSFLPGTEANRVFSGISRLDRNLTEGIKHLNGVERELAENVVNKWRAGEVSILGDPASKLTKMGFQPNARGILMGRNKPMMTAGSHGSMPAITLDGRMTGKTTAAHLAAMGVDLADDTVANNNLRTRVMGQAMPNAEGLSKLRERTLGNATTQLLDAGFISRPKGVQKLFGALRPGPLQDALWAADNVAANAIGKPHGTAAIPKMVKFGVGGLLAAGAGYFMMVKMPADAAKKQQEEMAKAQAEKAGAAGQAGGQAQSPELQAALQQFAAMPKEQQQQLIQQQYAALQQASQQPTPTAAQEQQFMAAVNELELFMQVANGGGASVAGGGAGATSAVGTPAAASGASAPAAAGGGGGTPAGSAFTAQGLGLAP